VTRLEEAIETQRAIEQSQRDFQGEISRLCVAEREAHRVRELERTNHKMLLNDLGGCPYGRGE